MQKKIPKELSHYTSKEIALEKILYEKSIRFGQLGLTNDPKETDGLFFPFAVQPMRNWQQELRRVFRQIGKIHNEEWKVLCLTKNLPKEKESNYPKHSEAVDYGFGYARPRMWSQYAQNHSGVCLIFDGQKLGESIRKTLSHRCTILHGPVSYVIGKYYSTVRERIVAIFDKGDYGPKEMRQYLIKNYESIFLTKLKDWEAESEFRWLVHSSSRRPEFVSIEGSLKHVLVGKEFPKVYEPALRELCKNLAVPAGRLTWAGAAPIPLFGNIYDPKTPK